MQILELPSEGDEDTITHPYFIGAQFHPELTSRPLTPQPMFMGLVAAALAHQYKGDESAWNTLFNKNPALRTWLYHRKNGSPQKSAH